MENSVTREKNVTRVRIMQSFDATNLLKMDEWLHRLKEKTKNKEMADYLSVLSFNQLVSESSLIKKEITEKPLNKEIITISKLFLKEIQDRLMQDSCEMSKSLKSIRNAIEKRVATLEI